jgi:hypothetical protein
VEAEMESSTSYSDLNAAPEFNSFADSVWKQLSQKRVAFFARYKAVFLCLLGSACLIYGLVCLLAHVTWLAHQVNSLEYLAHGIATSGAIIPR